jgi:hypothetical protein
VFDLIINEFLWFEYPRAILQQSGLTGEPSGTAKAHHRLPQEIDQGVGASSGCGQLSRWCFKEDRMRKCVCLELDMLECRRLALIKLAKNRTSYFPPLAVLALMCHHR